MGVDETGALSASLAAPNADGEASSEPSEAPGVSNSFSIDHDSCWRLRTLTV
ncbi:MAG: hypothetical protein ABSD78_14460 [Acidimicrobiales bacterium]|jgi:hypothetical protein